MSHRRFDTLFLAAALAGGAAFRLGGLGRPSLWLDEILGYDLALVRAKQPLWRWLTFFHPQHGPLYYATELAPSFIHPVEVAARLPAVVFGILTIAAAWFAATAVQTRPVARHVAAMLVALSPLEIYYSREARPYGLVLLLTTLLIALLLRGAETRIAIVLLLLLLAVYSSLAMMAAVVSVAVVASGAALRGERRFWLTVASAGFLAAAAMAIVYRNVPGGETATFPSLDATFFRGLIESFSVVAVDSTSVHRTAYVFLALAAIGAVDVGRRDRTQAVVLIGMALLPAALPIAGLRLEHHFFSIRYVLSAHPAYLLLVAIGVAAIVERIPYRTAAAIAIAALLAAQGWRAAVEEPYQKLDWRTIARTIAAHAHQNDAVIAANDWTRACLDFYLRRVTPRLRLFDARDSATLGQVFAYQHTTSWIVSANPLGDFAGWSCRFPVLLASPLENFRLQYSPTLYYFLTDRSTPAEQRALRASFGGGEPSLHFGPNEDVFFDPGWGGAEPENDRWARWAIGRQAHIALPLGAPSNRTLTLDVAPVDGPPQRLTISINGQPLTTLTLRSGRARYIVETPEPLWHRETVNILTFDFDHAIAPADVDRRSSDHRPLAARFYEVSLDGQKPPDEGAHLVRLTEDGPFLEGSEGGTPLPEFVDPQSLTRFVARLGFDPRRALADLLDGRLTLADLAAASLADDSVCLGNEQFLDSIFRALFGREISAPERAELGARLRRGEPRSRMVRGLVNAGETRRQALGVRR